MARFCYCELSVFWDVTQHCCSECQHFRGTSYLHPQGQWWNSQVLQVHIKDSGHLNPWQERGDRTPSGPIAVKRNCGKKTLFKTPMLSVRDMEFYKRVSHFRGYHHLSLAAPISFSSRPHIWTIFPCGLLLYLEYGDKIFLQNSGNFLPEYMESHPRRKSLSWPKKCWQMDTNVEWASHSTLINVTGSFTVWKQCHAITLNQGFSCSATMNPLPPKLIHKLTWALSALSISKK